MVVILLIGLIRVALIGYYSIQSRQDLETKSINEVAEVDTSPLPGGCNRYLEC